MTSSTVTRSRSAGERLTTGAANLFSFVFSPLLGPTYAIIAAWNTTVMLLLPTATMRTLLLMVAGLTCLFPLVAIGVMYKLGIVSDPGLNKRRERTLPFIVSAAGYVGCIILFVHISAPSWLTMFMAGGLAALVVAALVNLRWKISVHLTAMGGLVAFMLRLIVDHLTMFHPYGWLTAIIIATGLVGTSRLILDRHTPLQVLAGTLNGFICVFLFTSITF